MLISAGASEKERRKENEDFSSFLSEVKPIKLFKEVNYNFEQYVQAYGIHGTSFSL